MSNYTSDLPNEESIGEKLLRLQVIAFSTERQLEDIVTTALKVLKGIKEILKDLEQLLEKNSK